MNLAQDLLAADKNLTKGQQPKVFALSAGGSGPLRGTAAALK